MELDLQRDNIDRREASLTVARGSVSTVLANWDRLDDDTKKALLVAAMTRIEDLVVGLDEDALAIRLARS